MSSDQHDSDGNAHRENDHLPKETIEKIKSTLLYGVGYKRPPKETRFKKGQSGNPKGRPRTFDLGLGSARSTNALALKEAERLISVREGGETREIPAIEAVLRKQIASALGGNAYAQKHVIERHVWAECEERERRHKDIEFWEEYQKQKWEEIENASSRGEAPPSLLPHPDDIVLDYDKGVRIRGPIDEEELVRLKRGDQDTRRPHHAKRARRTRS
jgi:hypothetical protein